MIRVASLGAEPHYHVQVGAIFRNVSDFECVAGYVVPDPLVKEVEAQCASDTSPRLDLVLTDLHLGGMGEMEGIQKLKALLPSVRIVVLTSTECWNSALQAICAGADGYLMWRTPLPILRSRIREVLSGHYAVAAEVTHAMVDVLRRMGTLAADEAFLRAESPPFDLTPREEDVLRCLVAGLRYKQIALRLNISIDTVRSHIRNLYRKMGVSGSAAAVRRALSAGIV